MLTSVRSSWQVMSASVVALFIREIQKKIIRNVNSSRSLGIFLIFLEPLLHVSIWMIIKVGLSSSSYNQGIPAPLFILLGAIPFLFARNVIQKSSNAIKGNKNLFNFRQVRPIDPMLALILTELIINCLIFLIILVGFYWIDVSWHVNHIGYLLFNTLSLVLFLTGLTIILSILSFFFTFISTLMIVIMRVFYMLSGVFFSAEVLPDAVRPYFLANPLFQYIEILRQSFNNQTIHNDYTDPNYLFKCGIILLLLGLGTYIASRDKIMIEIEQR